MLMRILLERILRVRSSTLSLTQDLGMTSLWWKQRKVAVGYSGGRRRKYREWPGESGPGERSGESRQANGFDRGEGQLGMKARDWSERRQPSRRAGKTTGDWRVLRLLPG